MNKIVWAVIAVIVLIVLFSGCGGYNKMVKLDENVKGKWGVVQTQYQRRSDLVPNLVSTVKGAANFEQSTLTAVIEARASASQIKVDPDKLTPENIEKFQASQGQLTQALGKLMVLTENYPQLRATQQFGDLSAQLEGTENRIATARRDYTEAVQEYNSVIRSFPNNLTAGLFGFAVKGSFQADSAAQSAPKVQF